MQAHGRPSWSLHSALRSDASSPVTDSELRKVSSLSALSVEGQDMSTLHGDAAAIIKWIGQIRSTNTDGVEPFLSPAHEALHAPLRDDVVRDGNMAKQLLANAKHTDRSFFVVPKVVDMNDS